nr:hypothetical protein [Tanacetum cinerariifolium]
MTFIHNGEPATIDLARYEQRPVGSEPLTFLHNGAPATIDLEQFNAQTPKEKQMKHGEIGAPRNTGDAGVGAVPEVGSM